MKFINFQSSAKKEKKEKRKDQKKEPKEPKEREEQPEADLADEIVAAEPKSKDPFDTMPKGTFDMDSFKRSYSNEDESVSIPFFWEKFDPEHYSIWFGEYKYPEELTKVIIVVTYR